MNTFVDWLAFWLADFNLAATVLLAASLGAMTVCRQPAKRLAVAKAAILALTLLAELYALPGWSLISLRRSAAEISVDESNQAVAIDATPAELTPVVELGAVAEAVGQALPVVHPGTVATGPNVSWLRVIVTAYLAGCGIVAAWLLAGLVAAWRLVRRAKPASMELGNELHTAGNGGPTRMALLVSEEIDVAVALGVFRPHVLLPQAWVESRSADELQAILAHELAHVRNGDLRWLAASRLLLVLLWAQPLYWWLRRQMRLDQETLADAAAAEQTGRREYAEQLVAWARDMGVRPRPLLPASVGLWEGASQLRRRLAVLLDERLIVLRRCSRIWWLGTSLGLLTLAIVLSSATLEPAGEAQAKEQETAAHVATEGVIADSELDQAMGVAYAREGRAVEEGEIAGTVLDEAGRPVPDVTVDVWTWYPGNETRTDEKGRFQLNGFEPRQELEVEFRKPGYGPRHVAALPVGGAELIVKLDNRTFLEGRVVNEQGEPVVGQLIRASRGPFENPGVLIGEVWSETTSHDQGNYRLYLEPDKYNLQVRAPGKGLARQEIVIKAGEQRQFDIQLKRGPVFRAEVRDSVTDGPVAGIRLWNWRQRDIEGVSDENGELVIENMLPGKFEFNVSAAGEKRPNEIAGEYARWWSAGATHPHQRLELDDGSRGPQRNLGFQRNFDDLEFEVKADGEAVKIVVERCVRITGRVVDPNGKPVGGATVAPAKTGSGNSLTGDTRFSVRTADDGSFDMRLPASGAAKYNLVAHDGDYEQWRTWANGVGEVLQTKPGDVIEDVELKLSKPCIIKGRVLDAKGKFVANHQVRAHSADKFESRYYDPTTKTNDQGEFELRFIRPGKHYVQADPFWITAEDAPENTWRLVEVKEGVAVEGVELRLQPDGRPSSLGAVLLEMREKSAEKD